MKLKKIILCFLFLFMVSSQPIQAKSSKTILVASKQLPYLFLITIPDETHMQVRFIPRNMILPSPCKSSPLPLQKLDLVKEFPCVKESVEQFFHQKSQNYVYVHLNRLAKDLDLSYQKTDFHKLKNLCDYFANVVKHLEIKNIINYQHYIDSDLTLRDYYHFYHMFKGKKVHISYYYVPQIELGSSTLPMENRFHKKN